LRQHVDTSAKTEVSQYKSHQFPILESP
jgi:hypothetical protein